MNDRNIVSPSRHATGQLHGSLHIAHWVRPNWLSAGSTRGNCSNRSLNSISEMIGIAWSWQRLYLAAPIRSSATKKCRDADMNRLLINPNDFAMRFNFFFLSSENPLIMNRWPLAKAPNSPVGLQATKSSAQRLIGGGAFPLKDSAHWLCWSIS